MSSFSTREQQTLHSGTHPKDRLPTPETGLTVNRFPLGIQNYRSLQPQTGGNSDTISKIQFINVHHVHHVRVNKMNNRWTITIYNQSRSCPPTKIRTQDDTRCFSNLLRSPKNQTPNAGRHQISELPSARSKGGRLAEDNSVKAA